MPIGEALGEVAGVAFRLIVATVALGIDCIWAWGRIVIDDRFQRPDPSATDHRTATTVATAMVTAVPLLLTMACAPWHAGLDDDEVGRQVTERLQGSPAWTCTDVRVEAAADTSDTSRAWLVSAACREIDGPGGVERRYFVAVANRAERDSIARLRWYPTRDDALVGLAPIESPDDETAEGRRRVTLVLMIPVVGISIVLLAIVVLLYRPRAHRLPWTSGPGLGLRYKRPRPAQSKSTWTVNRDA